MYKFFDTMKSGYLDVKLIKVFERQGVRSTRTDIASMKIRRIALSDRILQWGNLDSKTFLDRIEVLVQRRKYTKKELLAPVKVFAKSHRWTREDAKRFGALLKMSKTPYKKLRYFYDNTTLVLKNYVDMALLRKISETFFMRDHPMLSFAADMTWHLQLKIEAMDAMLDALQPETPGFYIIGPKPKFAINRHPKTYLHYGFVNAHGELC